MEKDTLRKRLIKEAMIHEPKKGLLPKKSCLKKHSASFPSATFPANEAPVHSGENISRSNDEAVAVSVDRQEREGFQGDMFTARIRQDADLPRDHKLRRNCTEHPKAGSSTDSEETHSPYPLLKRKIEEADDAKDRAILDMPSKVAKMSRDGLRKYIKQKVQEANRALVLEDMAGKLGQCAR